MNGPLHNAQFNVLGLVDDGGGLVERYEYTPYGQRQVFTSAGTSDPYCMVPMLMGHRHWTTTEQPYGRNPYGHQGLYHDEETDLIYNRARMLHPRLGRFTQRDPLGYVDGMSTYAYYAGERGVVDPSGQAINSATGNPGGFLGEYMGLKLARWYYGGSKSPQEEISEALMKGAAQGALNALDGSKDGMIDLAELAIRYNAGANPHMHGIADCFHEYTLWARDWSKDVVVIENPTSRYWSKTLGGIGIDGLTGAYFIRFTSFGRASQPANYVEIAPANVVEVTILKKSERVSLFLRKLTESPASKNADEALDNIRRIMDEVEDAHSGIPKEVNPGLHSDRMYGPFDDKILRLDDGGMTAKINKGTVEITSQGDVTIKDATGKLIYTKEGARK